MLIETIVVTALEQNCRLVAHQETLSAAIVDPGGDVERIIAAVDDGSWIVEQVLLTHSHLDHCGAVAPLLDLLERRQGKRPLLLGHRSEMVMRQRVSEQAKIYGMGEDYSDCPEPDIYFDEQADDGLDLRIGDCPVKVFFTPGHSPGHLVFYLEKKFLGELTFKDGDSVKVLANPENVLLAGDTLFAGSIGRTDLWGGNTAQLLDSIKNKILRLPEDTLVLAGHGPSTTIGREIRTNPFLQGSDVF